MADSSTPSIVILGTDTVLAARPATAVQLAHACLKAGYRSAIPASWGDELLANEALHHLADPGRAPTAVYCVCPLVVGRLGSIAQDPATNVVALVSPPLATARYVRTLAGDAPLHITYVGGCPDGAEREIDARYTPEEFLARLAALGISPIEEPLVFDSILPADRRRFRSLPGGLPSAEALWSEGGARALAELDQPDFVADLAQRFLSRERTLIDVAARLGCACSGAVAGVPPLAARAAVSALEPPRATNSVVDESLDIPLLRRLPRQRTPAFAFAAIPAARATRGESTASEETLDAGAREGSESAATAVAAPVAEEGEPSVDVGASLPPDESRSVAAAERPGEPRREEPSMAGGAPEPALEIPEAPAGGASFETPGRGVPRAATPSDARPLPRAYLLRRRVTPRGGRAAAPTAAPRAPETREAREAERGKPLERERAIPSDVEPHPATPRTTSSRTPIVTGPVVKTAAPAAAAPTPPVAPAPPAARTAPPQMVEPARTPAPSPREIERTPQREPAREVRRVEPAPAWGAPEVTRGTSATSASPADALLDAWARLARERPLLQLAAMLALALLFGLLFALVFEAAGDAARSAEPRPDSAVGAVAAPAAADTPSTADTARRTPARGGAAGPRRAERTVRAPAAAAVRPPATRRAAVADTTPRTTGRAGGRTAAEGVAADSAVDSVAAAREREIEALREEFARRRARLDSLNRRVDSLAPPPPPATR